MASILLVEDDSLNREMLSRFLVLEGHTVVTAADGLAAVETALQERPDLILMDMGLPVLDGWSAVARIRRLPAIRATPIIALTAYAMSYERARCLGVGWDDYATKPVDFTQLRMRMRALLKPR